MNEAAEEGLWPEIPASSFRVAALPAAARRARRLASGAGCPGPGPGACSENPLRELAGWGFQGAGPRGAGSRRWLGGCALLPPLSPGWEEWTRWQGPRGSPRWAPGRPACGWLACWVLGGGWRAGPDGKTAARDWLGTDKEPVPAARAPGSVARRRCVGSPAPGRSRLERGQHQGQGGERRSCSRWDPSATAGICPGRSPGLARSRGRSPESPTRLHHPGYFRSCGPAACWSRRVRLSTTRAFPRSLLRPRPGNLPSHRHVRWAWEVFSGEGIPGSFSCQIFFSLGALPSLLL